MNVDRVQPRAAPPAVKAHHRQIALFFWPLAISTAALSGWILLWSISSDVALFAMPLLALWAVSALIALLKAARSVLARQWRRAVSLGLFPLVFFVVCLNFMRVRDFVIDTGQYIHFRAKRADFLAEVAKLPTNEGPRLMIISWGGFLGSYRAVVYDESDEVALPEGQRSAEWKARTAGTELSCDIVRARAVGDHFYIAATECLP